MKNHNTPVDKNNIDAAIHAIHHNGVICYPTEGVWSLGCHPQSVTAFQHLLQIKKRPLDKGVILLVANIAQLKPYAIIDQQMQQTLTKYKNDFITFVVPKAVNCPNHLSGDFDSIAVRITCFQPLHDFCLASQTALVSTSANISGQAPVRSISEAKQCFGNAIDAYVDQPLGGQQKPSRIVKWENTQWKIIRD